MTALPVLKMVCIDCADAQRSAEFWAELLGWDISLVEDGHVRIAGPGTTLGFDTIADYERPAWPNERGSKQVHFDLATDDLAASEKRCVELGATVPDHQPTEAWRVLIDPGGHPFCLTVAANWD